METVSNLRETMQSYKDVAVAMQVKDAISGLVKEEHIALEDKLSLDVLGKIYKYIDDASENKRDSFDFAALFFQATAGQTNNPVEAALKYIEQLRSSCEKCSCPA